MSKIPFWFPVNGSLFESFGNECLIEKVIWITNIIPINGWRLKSVCYFIAYLLLKINSNIIGVIFENIDKNI